MMAITIVRDWRLVQVLLNILRRIQNGIPIRMDIKEV